PFRLLLLCARAVKQTGKSALPLAYFCLWTLKLAGWMSSLEDCAVCGKPLGNEHAFVAPTLQGIACAQCRPAGSRLLPKEALALARRIQTEKLDRLAPANVPPLTVRELTSLLLDWIEWQAEKKFTS